MYCMQCGSALAENARFCNRCGTPVVGQLQPGQAPADIYSPPIHNYENQNIEYGYSSNGSIPHSPSMVWYKFIIYFQLFFTALIALVNAISFLDGSVYSFDSDFVEQVYISFPSLKILDIIMFAIYISLAVFALFVRQSLAKMRKNGPKLLYTFLLFSIVITILYFIVLATILRLFILDAIPPQMLGNLFVLVVQLIIDVIYFERRKYLFIY